MTEPNNEALARLLAKPPLLHFWDGQWFMGGFWPDTIRLMMKQAFRGDPSACNVVETGAGLTTLAFLCMGANQVVSIAPDENLFPRIIAEAEKLGVGTAHLKTYVDYSERILPGLVLERDPFIDFALIDGGHNLTNVWVDFTYLSYALKKDGVLAIDDVALYPPRQLVSYLKLNDGWEFLTKDDHSKTYYFAKRTDRRMEGDWVSSPFIKANCV